MSHPGGYNSDVTLEERQVKNWDKPDVEIEKATCSHFGCPKKLTLEESLCGTRCNKHQQGEKIDIMTVLQF